MKIATISSKGQITIPIEIQKSMNIGHGSKVMLNSDRDVLTIKPLKNSIVEQTAGSLRKYVDAEKLGVSFSKVREEAQRIAAAELAKKI